MKFFFSFIFFTRSFSFPAIQRTHRFLPQEFFKSPSFPANLTPEVGAGRLNKGQAAFIFWLFCLFFFCFFFLTALFQLASFSARLSLRRWFVGRLGTKSVCACVCVLCTWGQRVQLKAGYLKGLCQARPKWVNKNNQRRSSDNPGVQAEELERCRKTERQSRGICRWCLPEIKSCSYWNRSNSSIQLNSCHFVDFSF